MRVAALVKQVPAFEAMGLGGDGRLRREGLPLEMSAYCRRAVAQGVALARASGGSCTVVTMGPPAAEAVLREALCCGADTGLHLCDAAFAGADTLATAHALAAALTAEGPFDLVLVGRSSVDAETGQVGPQLAELLGLPFAAGVKRLEIVGGVAEVGLEHDDTWLEATVALPAVLSCAERLIDPCKIKDPDAWAAVDAARLRRVRAEDLGPGPWGAAASPTRVGELRTEVVEREGRVLSGPVHQQVAEVVAVLEDRGLLTPDPDAGILDEEVPATGGSGPVIGVVLEPGRARLARELLGGAARLVAAGHGRVVAVAPEPVDAAAVLGSWGADEVVCLRPAPPSGGTGPGVLVEEDVAGALVAWARGVEPWAVVTGSTAWGREVAGRAAAALGAGLTGDAVGLSFDQGRLVGWKPAFGGSVVAAVTATSPTQLVTVRPGVLALGRPRSVGSPAVSERAVVPRGRVRIRSVTREDQLDLLANADRVVGVGQGVDPTRYGELDALCDLLGAELAATRKVTDRGWLPHARQLGVTGHAISPRLYLALGTSGKFNHMAGVRSAGLVVAVNPDGAAPVFGYADLGVLGTWEQVVPELVAQLRARTGPPDGSAGPSRAG